MASNVQPGFRSLVAANRIPSGPAGNHNRSQREQKEVSMFLSSRSTLLAAVAAAVSLGLAPVTHADLSPVFEAALSGSGPGGVISGTTGGTATLVSQTNATASIVTGTNLAGVPGGYLNIAETGGSYAGGSGAYIVPTTAANGFASWWSATGSGPGGVDNTINGSFDYFYKDSLASTSWVGGSSQSILTTGGSGQFGINFVSQENGFQLWVHDGSVGNVVAGNYGNNGFNGSTGLAANTLIHIAGVVSTDPTSGDVTATFYAVTGNNPIIPGTTPVFATNSLDTSGVPLAFTTTSVTGPDFVFGYNDAGLAQTEQFDQFRIYAGTPTIFSALPTAIPEPATLGLMALGGLALLLPRRKRA